MYISDLKTRHSDNFVNNGRFFKSVIWKTDLKYIFCFCQQLFKSVIWLTDLKNGHLKFETRFTPSHFATARYLLCLPHSQNLLTLSLSLSLSLSALLRRTALSLRHSQHQAKTQRVVHFALSLFSVLSPCFPPPLFLLLLSTNPSHCLTEQRIVEESLHSRFIDFGLLWKCYVGTSVSGESICTERA